MTRGRCIIGIFSQNVHFLNVLVVWRAGVLVLAVCGASYKTSGNLGS
jgi:hypothetical protein